MSDEDTPKRGSKWQKVLGAGLFLAFFLGLTLGPRLFPEFFAENFSGEKLFGSFSRPVHAVYAMFGGLAGFFAAPFLFGPLIVKSVRKVSDKWYNLTYFGAVIFTIASLALIISFVYHCAEHVRLYYGNSFVADNFIFFIWGYFLLLGVLRVVVTLRNR
jgi:uncharacterized Tic20 family protein